MASIRRFPARRSLRAAGLALLGVGALLALACQSVPPVDEAAEASARYLRASSPIDWSSRSSACSDARDRARHAAQDRCEVVALSNVSDSCECQPGEAFAGSWRCSAVAAYVCAQDRIASRQP